MAETSSQQSSLKQFLAVSLPPQILKQRFVTLSLAAVESTTVSAKNKTRNRWHRKQTM
jgi:hypothetical protein